MATIENESELHNMSYLNARVHSIIAQNGPLGITNVPSSSTSAKPGDNLQTYLRVRKSQNCETLFKIENDTTLLCKLPKAIQNNRYNDPDNVITKLYKFSRVFGPEASQSQIFIDVVQNRMVDFINGVNCTLLTYGASGSGKTFTIVGNSNEPGIIPRSLEFLFRALPDLRHLPSIKPTPHGSILRLSKSESSNANSITNKLLSELQDINNHRVVYSAMQKELQDEAFPMVDENISDIHLSVWISFAEIYNEYVYDLLVPAMKRTEVRKKLRLVYLKNNAYIKNLTYVNVSSASDAYCVLQYGLQNLNYASTSINDHSSRSHSIFTIRLAQASNTKEGISVSAFNFCDLAGSERMKKTNNIGDRLKESNSINTSLMVLGRCISAIRDTQKLNNSHMIPFRDSKFTQLFQNALSGKETIFMIVNINPISNMFDESMHVLNFSAIAKDVTVDEQQLIERPKNKLPNEECQIDISVDDLKIQYAFLCEQIEQEKIDYEEEREYIIQKYKELIQNANTFWESKCQNLQARIVENKRIALDLVDINMQKNNKKRKKISVIIIDSSSDEEADMDELSKKRVNVNANKFKDLKKEMYLLKNRFEVNEVLLQNILKKNQSIQKSIDQSEAIYNDLRCEYHEELEELNLKILKQEETIATLNNYIESYNDKKLEEAIDI
ncbi:hypothetical protein RN001_001470 [Aquatica leii]|uniref:Kinesin motor domain-containing protein n=1 Tax=Aquatica leii TaxID=1421715 RepID=A0AAN7Q432_9COLE|nr:hypothetical protein RN001_001470 [Aquatica leii]